MRGSGSVTGPSIESNAGIFGNKNFWDVKSV